MPYSGAHYCQGQIMECPLRDWNTYVTKNSPCNISSTARKKTTLAGKSKWNTQKPRILFNQRQNINVKDWKENKTRIKISEFYKWYSSNTVDIKSARYLIFSLFFFVDFRSGSFSYISAKSAVKYLYKSNGLPRWKVFIDSPMIILGLFLVL